MAITADGTTLIVAESYANRLTGYDIGAAGGLDNRRVWADTPGDHPDGICIDDQGALWYADVGNQHCVRIREGGEVLTTVGLDRGAFACMLSRGEDPRLFVVGQHFDADSSSGRTGQVVAFPAPHPARGDPEGYHASRRGTQREAASGRGEAMATPVPRGRRTTCSSGSAGLCR